MSIELKGAIALKNVAGLYTVTVKGVTRVVTNSYENAYEEMWRLYEEQEVPYDKV